MGIRTADAIVFASGSPYCWWEVVFKATRNFTVRVPVIGPGASAVVGDTVDGATAIFRMRFARVKEWFEESVGAMWRA